MKIKSLLLLFLIFSFIHSSAQSFSWIKKFNTDQAGSLRHTIISNDNQYIACGYINQSGYIIKTDTSGIKIWDKTYPFLKEVYQINQLSDNGFIIFAVDSTDQYSLIRTDAAGDTLWRKFIHCNYVFNNSHFVVREENHIIISYTTNDTIHLNQFDLTGQFLWEKRFSGVQRATSSCISITADGGYLIGGSTYIDTLTFNKDMYIIKTNKNGDTLWTRVVNIEGAEQMAGIVETPEKEFMAAFQSGAS